METKSGSLPPCRAGLIASPRKVDSTTGLEINCQVTHTQLHGTHMCEMETTVLANS